MGPSPAHARVGVPAISAVVTIALRRCTTLDRSEAMLQEWRQTYGERSAKMHNLCQAVLIRSKSSCDPRSTGHSLSVSDIGSQAAALALAGLPCNFRP